MDTIRFFWEHVRYVLNFPLVNLGTVPITLWTLIYMLVLIVLLFFVTARIRTWVSEGLLARRKVDIGVRQTVGSIVRYVILFLGFIIILQTAGINLSALAIFSGAIGLGIGFGLQNITSNFVSGLIILFERPIRIGDTVEVGDIQGEVVRISARATTLITNDNISVIVPNSEFVSSKVINWSIPNPNVRFSLPVFVAYRFRSGESAKIITRNCAKSSRSFEGACHRRSVPGVWRKRSAFCASRMDAEVYPSSECSSQRFKFSDPSEISGAGYRNPISQTLGHS